MSEQNGKKFSVLNYVRNLMGKRDNQLREEDDTAQTLDKDSVVNKMDEEDFEHINLENQTFGPTDIDHDPVIETREGDEHTYKQSVYVRQYQAPTPEPVDIQVQEVLLTPSVQHPPIHVYIEPNEPRTPSPISIKSTPSEAPLSSTNQPIFYNKYIPVNYKPPPTRQIVIHRDPELPPKSRPIEWLPNKPPSKRIVYHHINDKEFTQNDTKRQYNRYIEYKKPRTIIELEIIRSSIIEIDSKEYQTRSDPLTQLNHRRTFTHDLDLLHWRI